MGDFLSAALAWATVARYGVRLRTLWFGTLKGSSRAAAGWLLNRTDQQSIMYAVTTTTAATANQKEWVKQLLHPVAPWF
jgi:hypothetical protein